MSNRPKGSFSRSGNTNDFADGSTSYEGGSDFVHRMYRIGKILYYYFLYFYVFLEVSKDLFIN